MVGDDIPIGIEGPLAEYQALRSEIDRRSNVQQALIALQATSAASIAAFVLSHDGDVNLLLVLPPFALIIGHQWYDHHQVIRSIGAYIGSTLNARVPGGFGWERRPRLPTLLQRVAHANFLAAAYGIFPSASIAAIIAWDVNVSDSKRHVAGWPRAVWWLDLFIGAEQLAQLAVLIWTYVSQRPE